MNAVAIVLCAILAVANAGVIHQSVPLVHAVPVVHQVPVLHAVHAAPVITKVYPAAQSSSFSYRAPAAKLAVPVVALHTPVIAHQLHATPFVMHQVLLH